MTRRAGCGVRGMFVALSMFVLSHRPFLVHSRFVRIVRPISPTLPPLCPVHFVQRLFRALCAHFTFCSKAFLSINPSIGCVYLNTTILMFVQIMFTLHSVADFAVPSVDETTKV